MDKTRHMILVSIFFNNCINRFNFTLAQINIRWFFEIGVTAKINLNYKPE